MGRGKLYTRTQKLNLRNTALKRIKDEWFPEYKYVTYIVITENQIKTSLSLKVRINQKEWEDRVNRLASKNYRVKTPSVSQGYRHKNHNGNPKLQKWDIPVKYLKDLEREKDEIKNYYYEK